EGAFGLNPNTTMGEIWSEMLEVPQPDRQPRVVERMNGGFGSDEFLDFGSMTIGAGRAFTLTDNADPRARSTTAPGGALVGKSWVQLDGKTFLVEAVPFTEINVLAQMLPAREARKSTGRRDSLRLMARATETEGRHRPQSLGTKSRADFRKSAVVQMAR